MSPQHYADVMEFWHVRQRPETLQPMLRSLSENGFLNSAENQMLAGAFFSRLLIGRKLGPEEFVKWCADFGRPARRMAAWALHLADMDAIFLQNAFLEKEDAILMEQIKKTPVRLEKWLIAEPAVADMFWGAFMADGDDKWLDGIIDAALRLNNGLATRGEVRTAKIACAILWKYAPRHEKVLKKLSDRSRTALESSDRKLLEYLMQPEIKASHGESPG